MRVAAALVLAFGLLDTAGPDLGIPSSLADYRSWTPLLDQPHQVSARLWALCIAPPPALVQEESGIHANRVVMVYATPPAAVAAFAELERRPFPTGTVLAKEKLDGSAPAGVAFMIKRDTPRFADSGGWEFTFYPPGQDLRAATRTHAHCADCHRSAITRDYVFGDYAAAARRGRVTGDRSPDPAAKSN